MNLLDTIRSFNAVSGRIAPALSAKVSRRVLMRPRRYAAKPWETAAVAAAERIHFRFGLSGLRWGERDAPVVLMLHGWEGRASQFAHFVQPLVEQGRQVIALDAPGHGESPGEESNAILFAYAAVEAAAEIPNLEAVIGHSMGAGALAYAISLGLSPERVVLLGGPSSLRQVLERYADGVNLTTHARPHFFKAVERHTGVNPDDVDIRKIAESLGHLPALIVHDRRDSMVPFTDGEAVARHWKNAEFMPTDGLGHWRILSDAAVVARVTSFLVDAPALRRVA